MTFKQIQDFIENKMRMSHIYQPLLIKTLVESEGIISTRKLALEFLKMDESQIQYYERVVKTMPVKVLLNHDDTEKYVQFLESLGLIFLKDDKAIVSRYLN